MTAGYKCMACMDNGCSICAEYQSTCKKCGDSYFLRNGQHKCGNQLELLRSKKENSVKNIHESKFKIGQACLCGSLPLIVNEVHFSHVGIIYVCRMQNGYLSNFDEFELAKI